MRRDIVNVWVGCLVIGVVVGFHEARAEQPNAGRVDASTASVEGSSRDAVARARLARLRAELELLQIEHDADVSALKRFIEESRLSELSAQRQRGPARDEDESPQTHVEGAIRSPADNLPGDADEGDDPRLDAEPRLCDEPLRRVRVVPDRERDAFLRRSIDLHSKKLFLQELEARYQKHGADALVSASPAPVAGRISQPNAEPARADDREPILEPISDDSETRRTSASRIEVCDRGAERANRLPVVDPPPPAPGGTPLPGCCDDPPSEEEIWAKVQNGTQGAPTWFLSKRNNVRILTEKIGVKIDACKVYPLAGPCQLVHCHYKSTVYYDELYWSDYPIPLNHVDHRVEVVYIQKDYLRRCPAPAEKPAAKPTAPGFIHTDAQVPILDPIPSEFAPGCCLDPPSEQDVWERVPPVKSGNPPFHERQRNNVRMRMEKVGENIGPPVTYPDAGECRLVHCQYQCTVSYDEVEWSDFPVPTKSVEHKEFVVRICKDHLRRCVPAQEKTIDRSTAAVRPAPRADPADNESRDRRIERMEAKLDAILDSLRRDGQAAGRARRE
jgi:hypothetical protein